MVYDSRGDDSRGRPADIRQSDSAPAERDLARRRDRDGGGDRGFRAALTTAIVAKDVAKLKSMDSESFVHTHTTGKLDGRDARIIAALAGEPVIERAEARDVKIRVPGGWTAIATGTSPITAMSDGKTYAVDWTAVYVRNEAGGWQLAASHATRVGEWAK